jgi:hypothetical protein
LLNDDQKGEPVRQFLFLRTQLHRAAARSSSEFWTVKGSWTNWVNGSTGSRMGVYEEIPHRVRETIGPGNRCSLCSSTQIALTSWTFGHSVLKLQSLTLWRT